MRASSDAAMSMLDVSHAEAVAATEGAAVDGHRAFEDEGIGLVVPCSAYDCVWPSQELRLEPRVLVDLHAVACRGVDGQ